MTWLRGMMAGLAPSCAQASTGGHRGQRVGKLKWDDGWRGWRHLAGTPRGPRQGWGESVSSTEAGRVVAHFAHWQLAGAHACYRSTPGRQTGLRHALHSSASRTCRAARSSADMPSSRSLRRYCCTHWRQAAERSCKREDCGGGGGGWVGECGVALLLRAAACISASNGAQQGGAAKRTDGRGHRHCKAHHPLAKQQHSAAAQQRDVPTSSRGPSTSASAGGRPASAAAESLSAGGMVLRLRKVLV